MATRTPPPRATIVIPTHRGADRLPILLDALVAQEGAPPFDVVAVIDGVDHATAAVLDRYRDRLALTVLTNSTNLGIGATLARGYTAATGEILIRCDDDITPSADFVRRHCQWHEPGTDRGVISATRDHFDDTAYARAYGRPAAERLLAGFYSRPASERWVGWAACNSLRRATYERVGGVNPDLTYSEDLDLGYRLSADGVELVVDPRLEVTHRGPVTRAADRSRRAYVSGSARAGFEARHALDRDQEDHPAGVKARLWDAMVSALAASVRTPAAARRAGVIVDYILPWLPSGAGGRLVSLIVEGSGRAGRRDAHVDWARADERR